MIALRSSLAILLLLFAAAPAPAQDALQVRVARNGDGVLIDVNLLVDAPPRIVWAVLTDYERMASFISSVKASTIVARHAGSLDVAQSGKTTVMMMSFSFAAVRRVELLAEREIRSTLLSGDFKRYVSTTGLVEEGSGTRLTHHGDYAPKSWVPPMIGPSVIERETRKQYREFVAEIMRRKALEKH